MYRRMVRGAKTTKTRGVKKGMYIPGTGPDYRHYIRCQHCGFICDTKRDQLSKFSGVVPPDSQDYTLPSPRPDYFNPYVPPYTPVPSTISHNCPFCGGQYTK